MPETAEHPASNQASLSRIAELQQLDSMQYLPVEEIELLAKHATLRVFEQQSTIIVEGDSGRHVFLLLSGTVKQTMRDQDGDDILLSPLGPGDLFGEGVLFGLRYRRTSVHALTRTHILQFKAADLQSNADQLTHFFRSLRVRFRERLLQTTLARVSLLAPLTPVERLDISQQLDDQHFERGVEIIQAGGISEGLYIVAEGQAVVVHDAQRIAVLQPGDVFGEMSLLDNEPHEASIVALTPIHLLILPRRTFDYLLARRADVAEGLQQMAQQRRQHDRQPEHIAVMEQLVATGIVRGKMALARQTELCDPTCHLCEDACAKRFKLPRLGFSSQMFGPLEAANSCHNCQWGAECVEACPEDAIRLNQDGFLVITDRCTGCGDCVDACPYNAINQVPVYPETNSMLGWLLRHTRRVEPAMLRANKCDACSGYDDHACISACPSNALHWIPVEQLLQTTFSQPQHDLVHR
ncbi:MAG: cyclic nucleotide-binding domain-containing protein [Chloroflexi bacterium]|nr:cyclic nucleotide-binding domain-containing protein [Chloroflexota bacterium]